MSIVLRPYDIGCEPSPSGPAETVVQSGWSTFVLFRAVSKSVDETGYLRDLGVAVVECQGCSMTKFGYPNDEGRPEHPLYKFGMRDPESSILELTESPWAEEVALQSKASALRIWSGRDVQWRRPLGEPSKHFVILLKETTFECVADALVVRVFAKSFAEALAYVYERFAEH